MHFLEMIPQIFAAIIIVIVLCRWYEIKSIDDKLKWMLRIPGLPLIGNALELGKATETLRVLMGYTKVSDGLCAVNAGTKRMIIASNYEFLEFVLSSTKILNKSSEYKYLESWLGNGLLTSTVKRWKKSRKVLTPAFHFSILEEFVSTFETNGKIMIDLLAKEVDKDSVDIYPYVRMCTLDIICETAMGLSINAQTNCDSDYVFAVKEMCRITFERSLSPIKMFDLLYPLCIDFYRERRYLKTLHDYTDSVIRSRRQELAKGNKQIENDEQVGSKKKMAFLDLLLNTTMDGKPLSDDFIREEVDTFMFEGHDTTSSAISFALYCLAQHPVIQERAFEEQTILFAKDRSKPVTYRDIQEMKYLDLVIKEVLRLYPSVPLIGRAADKDIEFKDGHVIPKDVSIFIFVYGANRDPKYFSEPEKFDPTRFENADGSYPYSYIPFSAGSRNCIGQKFAMLEVKSAISKVLRNFELLPATPKHEPVLLPQAVLSSANGIRIKIRRRKWDFLFMDN